MIASDPFLIWLAGFGIFILVSFVIIFVSVALNVWWGWHG